MVRTVGLWRAVVHRSRADWPVVAAAFALLVCAIGLLATGALYAETVALGGLRQAVLAAPPAERTVVVRTAAAPADVAAIDAKVRGELGATLAATGGEIALVGGSGTLAPEGMDADAAREQPHAHRELRGPRPACDADRRPVARRRWPAARGHAVGGGRRVARAGTRRPGPAGARARRRRGHRARGRRAVATAGRRPVLPRGHARARRHPARREPHDARAVRRRPRRTSPRPSTGRQLDLAWRGLPSIDGLAVDRIDGLRTGVEALRPALRSALPPPREVSVDDEPPVDPGRCVAARSSSAGAGSRCSRSSSRSWPATRSSWSPAC